MSAYTNMDITLEDPAGTKLHFPVNPTEINIRRDKSFETVSIIYGGELDVPQGVRVKEIAFSSFFPNPEAYDASYCKYQPLPDPQTAMNQLNTWMEGKQPLRLIITGTAVNVLVMLSAHNSSFRGGEVGDVYFDLIFRTWKDYQIRLLSEREGGAAASSARPDIKPVPATYIVQSGDTLWNIAKMKLGSGSRWKDIYDANRQTIGASPDLIYPGQKLVMP